MRSKLPNRRNSEIITFEIAGVEYRAQVSRFADGRIAELFLDGPKIGSSAQIAAHDAAVCASLALQCGITAGDLQHSLTKLANGKPAGPVGIALSMAEAPHAPG